MRSALHYPASTSTSSGGFVESARTPERHSRDVFPLSTSANNNNKHPNKEKSILHIVVANAAFVELAPPSTATPEHYDKTFNTNARGTFFAIQKAVPLMTAGGAIVTVGSVAYKKGLPPMTAYSSAKAAIRYSVKGWAAELIGKGIRVNNLSPGVIDTPIIDGQPVLSHFDTVSNLLRPLMGTSGLLLAKASLKRC
jgi:NAD(P)-dependent dehydrogenase (short-subunit alcohol dehydrogenase family)